jgi:DNA polymerase-3 subunit delta'
VGKTTAALAFARAVLCERVHGAAPVDAEPSLFGDAPSGAGAGTGDDACGECRGCRMSTTLQHPDLRFLFPLSGEEKTLESTIIETLQELRDDPLYVFQYEKAASIRISQTRELLAELGYRPHTASRRVVVVRDCDRMREDQFSALLKSVEEPGASTLWVLTTARLSRVPVTIRSRCQRVRFAPLPESLVRDTLQRVAGVDEKDARMLAALSSGSLARALAMRDADPGMKQQRDDALALLAPALTGDSGALWSGIQKTTAFGKAGRERLRQVLEFHQLWLRDLLRTRYGAGPEELVNRDQVARLKELAARIDAAEIRRRLLVLEEALRSIDGNVSADLTLFSTLSRVGGERLGEGAWPAHATARWDV